MPAAHIQMVLQNIKGRKENTNTEILTADDAGRRMDVLYYPFNFSVALKIFKLKS